MNPVEIAIYCLQAGVFVLSLFFGIKILVTPIMEREHWRELLKRRIYFNRKRFQLLLNTLAVALLIVAVYTGYINVRNLLINWG
jgi:hypothetical protein